MQVEFSLNETTWLPSYTLAVGTIHVAVVFALLPCFPQSFIEVHHFKLGLLQRS